VSHNNAIIMSHRKEVFIMPTIMPIRDLRNTSEISELAHKKQEPIFITKNGYSDLVVMSAELYERFAQINKIDQAIFEAEAEVNDGAEPIALDSAMERLNKKYHG
jgi:prevent-host-death family protein